MCNVILVSSVISRSVSLASASSSSISIRNAFILTVAEYY